MYLHHDSLGMCVFVNLRQDQILRRHSYIHEYAHVLLERQRAAVVSKLSNATELVEKRANAFSSAFLLPADGVRDALTAIGKGQPSRKVYLVFDGGTGDMVRAETRSVPGSQMLTFQDVGRIARRFCVPYRATVARLANLEVLSEKDAKAFSTDRHQAAAQDGAALFGDDLKRSQPETAKRAHAQQLKSDLVDLAIEGYRRRVIDKVGLAALAARLRHPGLSARRLLKLAEIAR
jgi:Zn-dependent peptidase ImmA (M78 family)